MIGLMSSPPRDAGRVPTATVYPEPTVASYLDVALRAGARAVKVHVQVGAFDPRSELLDKAWGMIAYVGRPVVVHCGHGPADWVPRLVDLADRIVLGTDFPSIPHPYAEQLAAIAGWAAADERLGVGFLRAVLHDTPARLLGGGVHS